jgi:hypothetical protein
MLVFEGCLLKLEYGYKLMTCFVHISFHLNIQSPHIVTIKKTINYLFKILKQFQYH